ncbi:Na+/H+ antiporter NhaC [Aestuariibacter sp. GS-14]|uniref:Na+/H+ antiporter NhaC n=1 Tax=Aestuariibacter sp. GS-14 TaxID=2590670 RepID=UPI0015E844D0|nr:Na+/H+ antiporter NhaC [Aestuariibacter sp. GS-14]
MTSQQEIKQPSLLDAFIPIVALVLMMGTAVFLFADNSSFGPNQIALLIGTGLAAIIGMKNGHRWADIEAGIIQGISVSLGACLILLVVGALIGTWMLAGTVPTLIYYGLELLNPSMFYAASCLICAVVAMSIGSSWTTAATVGVALMGVAAGMDMSAAITAGAVVSGAYFGDKISPLSETTNLAPAVAGVDLFDHIRYMLWTTIPSFVLALLLFVILGFSASTDQSAAKIHEMQQLLDNTFNLNLLMLVPLVVLLTLAVRKMPAFPAVAIGALLGGAWAIIFQGDVILGMKDGADSNVVGTVKVVWTALFDGVSFDTGDTTLDSLLSRGGMSSMLNTIWLIICAMSFGAVLERVGLLNRAVSAILHGAKTAGAMVTRTILTCIGTNLITADQYMAIVMPGRMYKQEFEKRGLNQLNLSRSLEDGGTLTSPLIPWNTCGAYMHGVLMVHPFEYIFYAFFNVINPFLAMIYAYLGIKILRITPPEIVVESSSTK